MPPFHVYSPFSTSDPRSHPILEVSQFEYLGLILDPKLTIHLATVEDIRRASQGQVLVITVCKQGMTVFSKTSYSEFHKPFQHHMYKGEHETQPDED